MLAARDNDNKQRVARLSGLDHVRQAHLPHSRGTQNPAPEPIDGTTSKVIIRGIGADYGKEMQFKVLTSPGGKANAVKELLSIQWLTGGADQVGRQWRGAGRHATYSPGTIFARPPERKSWPGTCDPPCWPASSPPPWP